MSEGLIYRGKFTNKVAAFTASTVILKHTYMKPLHVVGQEADRFRLKSKYGYVGKGV